MEKNMKEFVTCCVICLMWLSCALPAAPISTDEKELTKAFPSFAGWTKKGEPEIYTPDNLYEYIDGAADAFLSYDFQKLATLTYEKDKKSSYTVDLYQHSSDRNGFGIYSQEKPRDGSFLALGTQGYYEKGILNFFKGHYYVKMSGYDLGDDDEKVLTTAARAIASALEGSGTFPAAVKCFPATGKIANSEAYINRNFLGHSFLHSAYVADYEVKGQKFQVFIMEADSPRGVEEILANYTDFVKKKGITVEQDKNFYRFQDPYYSSSGMMNLKAQSNWLWGLFCPDNTLAAALIDEIAANLKKNNLIP
jgi:hypothetical protein